MNTTMNIGNGKLISLRLEVLAFIIAFAFSNATYAQQDWTKGGNNLSPLNSVPTIGTDATWNSPLQLITHGIERMRITENGNVGIGITTFPNAGIGLHVQSPMSSTFTTSGWNPTLVLTGHPGNPNPALIWNGGANHSYFIAHPSTNPAGDVWSGHVANLTGGATPTYSYRIFGNNDLAHQLEAPNRTLGTVQFFQNVVIQSNAPITLPINVAPTGFDVRFRVHDGLIQSTPLGGTFPQISSAPFANEGLVVANNAGILNRKINLTGSNADFLRGDGTWVAGGPGNNFQLCNLNPANQFNNFITKFTNPVGNQLCKSIIFDNGTNVGIGTTFPLAKTDIMQGGNTTGQLRLTNFNVGFLSAFTDFRTTPDGHLLINPFNFDFFQPAFTGPRNVGVGVSGIPQARLDINGNLRIGVVTSSTSNQFLVRNTTSGIVESRNITIPTTIGNVTSCGTSQVNFLTKYTVAGTSPTICNSLIIDNGTEIGMNAPTLSGFRVSIGGNNMGSLFMRSTQTGPWGNAQISEVSHRLTKSYVVSLGGLHNFMVYGEGSSLARIGHFTFSDSNFKENIVPITNAMDKIMDLNGVYFNRRIQPGDSSGIPHPTELGFLEQNVSAVVPEAVRSFDSTGIRGVAYQNLVALLVEGMKELKAELDSVKENCCANPESRVNQGNNNNNQNNNSNKTQITEKEITLTGEVSWLGQNIPNPFGKNTSVPLFLAQNVKEAQLVFYDMAGKTLQVVEVEERGEVKYHLKTEGLAAGIYTYSLVLEGVGFKTRRMVRE